MFANLQSALITQVDSARSDSGTGGFTIDSAWSRSGTLPVEDSVPVGKREKTATYDCAFWLRRERE
jgi:hypothetical protein